MNNLMLPVDNEFPLKQFLEEFDKHNKQQLSKAVKKSEVEDKALKDFDTEDK